MRRHLLTLYGITAMLHAIFAVALNGVLGWWHVPSSVVTVATPAALLTVVFHFRVTLLRSDRPVSRVRRGLEELYHAHWVALLLTLMGALPLTLIFLLAGRPLASWRGVSELCAVGYALGLVLGVYGVMVRRRLPKVRRFEVVIAGLDPAFDGFSIAQLSDLHVGSLCPRQRVLGWVRRANALDADVVALTGDYVTSGVCFHEDIADALGELRARMGVYAVMGNHDYFGDGQPLLDLLDERDVHVLRNEHVVLSRGEARLCLAGVDDVYTRRIDIDAALHGRDSTFPLMVLAHDPRSFDALAARGAALVLSGHTHWGQLALPLWPTRFNLARALVRYPAGWYRRGTAQLYVSPGLGTTGPPVRLGTWPEISVFVLRSS
jgi:uncharacterized protein